MKSVKIKSFCTVVEKFIYKRKKESSLISIPPHKKVKLGKIIIKHSQANKVITQSMFNMIGRKGNFILFMSFHLLPVIGSLIRTAQIKKSRSNMKDI